MANVHITHVNRLNCVYEVDFDRYNDHENISFNLSVDISEARDIYHMLGESSQTVSDLGSRM